MHSPGPSPPCFWFTLGTLFWPRSVGSCPERRAALGSGPRRCLPAGTLLSWLDETGLPLPPALSPGPLHGLQCLLILSSLLYPPAAHFLPWMMDVGRETAPLALGLHPHYCVLVLTTHEEGKTLSDLPPQSPQDLKAKPTTSDSDPRHCGGLRGQPK